MDDVELRDLEHFVAVGEELHFGRAAARLHIVPAAVSQRIRELERTWGVRLFERTSRRVVLTEAGTRLLSEAQRVLAAAQSADSLAASLRAGRMGRLRIGFAPGSTDLIDTLARLVTAKQAELELLAVSMWGVQALTAVARGELDLALVRDVQEVEGVASVPIATYHDSFVAVACPGPLANHTKVSLREFEQQSVLIPEREAIPVLYDALQRFFRDHEVTPIWYHHRLHEQEQQLSLVAAGLGSALLHAHHANLSRPGVAVLPLLEEGPESCFYLAWRQADTSAAVRAVVDLAVNLEPLPAGLTRPAEQRR
ncbi:LysR family transcriptional regulator [Mycobacteroides abscessus]|uniref:LysR family transcriptional regulator n=1 Tax=Mycobacteroides abscessus TaxID=36809 RepID=UPI0027E36D99|nr:LysR substrate-binding domain-containing protein [Mycobacteroides abscessus]